MVTAYGLSVEGLVVAGLVLLSMIATLAAVGVALSARRSARAGHSVAPPPPTPAGSGEPQGRVEQAARSLSALASRVRPVTVEAMRQRLALAASSPAQAYYAGVAAEVADGLVMVAHAVPAAALHDTTVRLLAKLRAQVGSRTFLYVCGHIATALRQPEHEDLAEGLRCGNLSWMEFLFLLRAVPLGEVRGSHELGEGQGRAKLIPEPEEHPRVMASVL